jgi:hypothetical protein
LTNFGFNRLRSFRSEHTCTIYLWSVGVLCINKFLHFKTCIFIYPVDKTFQTNFTSSKRHHPLWRTLHQRGIINLFIHIVCPIFFHASCWTDSEEILYQNEFMIFRSINTLKTLITKKSEVFSILDTRSVHSKSTKEFPIRTTLITTHHRGKGKTVHIKHFYYTGIYVIITVLG